MVLTVPSVWTQSNASQERITLSPAVSRPELKAGEVKQGKLTVINDGQTDYTFKLSAAPLSFEGELYNPNFTEINERTRAFEWVSFEKTTNQLAAGSRVEVNYTITVPQRAAPGGHYAVLFAETQPPEDTVNVARKKRVGNLLYMSVQGEVEESGLLLTFEAPLWQTSSPVSSMLRIKNEGNVHFTADYNVQYKNIFGKTHFEIEKESLIMPGTTRQIPLIFEDTPYFGIFRVGGTVEFLDTTEQLPTRYVVLLPYPLLIGIVVVVLAVLLSAMKRRSSRGGVHFAGTKKRR